MEIINDMHDYAKGTWVRRISKKILTKPVFWLLKLALRLNPDAVIIANAKFGMDGSCVFIEGGQVAVMERVSIENSPRAVAFRWRH